MWAHTPRWGTYVKAARDHTSNNYGTEHNTHQREQRPQPGSAAAGGNTHQRGERSPTGSTAAKNSTHQQKQHPPAKTATWHPLRPVAAGPVSGAKHSPTGLWLIQPGLQRPQRRANHSWHPLCWRRNELNRICPGRELASIDLAPQTGFQPRQQ